MTKYQQSIHAILSVTCVTFYRPCTCNARNREYDQNKIKPTALGGIIKISSKNQWLHASFSKADINIIKETARIIQPPAIELKYQIIIMKSKCI